MNRGRILIVEDDFDISNLPRIFFDGEGYEFDELPPMLTSLDGGALKMEGSQAMFHLGYCYPSVPYEPTNKTLKTSFKSPNHPRMLGSWKGRPSP